MRQGKPTPWPHLALITAGQRHRNPRGDSGPPPRRKDRRVHRKQIEPRIAYVGIFRKPGIISQAHEGHLDVSSGRIAFAHCSVPIQRRDHRSMVRRAFVPPRYDVNLAASEA